MEVTTTTGGDVITARELLVGAYSRRSDDAEVKVVRIDGTRTFLAYVNGVKIETDGSRNAAMKLALA